MNKIVFTLILPHKSHLQPLPIKTMRTHLLWQKEALNEGIHVCNAFMVHRPGKLTNKLKRMLKHSVSVYVYHVYHSFSPCMYS